MKYEIRWEYGRWTVSLRDKQGQLVWFGSYDATNVPLRWVLHYCRRKPTTIIPA